MAELTLLQYFLIALAALAAGMVNALAGGGTLITFPVLSAVGLDVITANITNTVALCPGYFGGTLAQAKDLRGQEKRVRLLVPTAIVGGIVGGILLLNTDKRVFAALIPYLILMAAGLLAFQGPMRKWVISRTKQADPSHENRFFAIIPIFFAAVYGGYFGAGLGVIFLATLGLVLEDTLTRLNALKQVLSFSVNIAAALFFLFSGHIHWVAAVVMAVAALAGGALGGRMAGLIPPTLLRWLVVSIGVIVAIIYFLR